MGMGSRPPEVMVALQGTLDTFALADVLRLLAATHKTGRLRVTGDRGSGSVWVVDGRVVATELAVPGAGSGDPAETLFTLLRFVDGSFTFESGAETPSAGDAREIEPLLNQAEDLLAEWRSIEAVVPSLEAWLTLRPEIERDVVVDADRWRVIAAVAGGASAASVGEALGTGELDTLRAVKELVELGLLEVGERPLGATTTVSSIGADDPSLADAPSLAGLSVDREPAPPSLEEMRSGLGAVHLSDEPPSFGSGTPAPHEGFDADAAEGQTLDDVVGSGQMPPPPPPPVPPVAPPAPMASVPTGGSSSSGPAPTGEPILDDAAEIARQLANLSPRAAATATTDEEREAALAAIEAEDETVNRGLLLRFLGSVDS